MLEPRNTIKKHQRYIGTFIKFGKKGKDKSEQTLLLFDIKDERMQIKRKHLWIHNIPKLDHLYLQKGDLLQFEATAEEYSKRHPSQDYGVTLAKGAGNVRKFRRVQEGELLITKGLQVDKT